MKNIPSINLRFKNYVAKVAGILPVFLLMNACTRPENHQSKLNLVVPNKIEVSELKNQSLKSSLRSLKSISLMHVVVNITGPGINVPIVINNDAEEKCRGCTVMPALPEKISFPNLPTGSGRLIQVLAVYASTANESKNMGAIYYGDNSENLANFDRAEVSVEIPVDLKASGNLQSGTLIGRYLNDATSGPTGPLEIRYKPNAGLPMVIDRSFMTNGWFNSFLLKTVPFDIALAGSNQILFTNASLKSMAKNIGATTTQKMKIDFPDNYNQQKSSNDDGQSLILGYFGPGAAHQIVCSPSTYTFKNLMQIENHSAPLSYRSDTGVQLVGGLNCTKDSITDNEMWNSKLYFDPTQMDGQGSKEFAGGYFSAFSLDSNQNPIKIDKDQSTNSLSFSFTLLPGINSVADKVSIYYRGNPDFKDFEMNHRPDCQQISNGGYGFLKAIDIPLVASKLTYSENKALSQINGLSSILEANASPIFVTCILKQDQVVAQGVSWSPNNGSGGGNCSNQNGSSTNGNGTTGSGANAGGTNCGTNGGQNGVVTAHLQKFFPENFAVADSCFQVNVGLLNANSINNSISGVQFLRNGLVTSAYTDFAYCQNSINELTNINIVANQYQSLWVKAGASGTDTWTLSTTGSNSVSIVNGVSSAVGIDLEMPDSFVSSFCYPAKAISKYPNGQTATVTTALNFSLTLPTGIQAYFDPACSQTIPISPLSLTITAATSEKVFYLKLTGTLSNSNSNNISVVPTTGNTVNFGTNRYVMQTTDRVVTSLNLMADMTNFQAGQCVGVTLEPRNSIFQRIPGSAIVTLSTSNVSGQYYSDMDCNTAITGTTISLSNEIKRKIYFKAKTYDSNQSIYQLIATMNGVSYPIIININGPIGKIAVSTSDGHNRLPINTCTEFTVQLKDLSGASFTTSNPVSLQLSTFNNVSFNNVSFYSNLTDCSGTTNPITNVTIPSSTSQVSVWSKFTDNQKINLNIMETVSASQSPKFLGTSESFYATNFNSISSTQNKLILNRTYFSYGQCIRGQIELVDSNNNQYAYNNSTSTNLGFNPPTFSDSSANYYASDDCTGTSSETIYLAPGNTSVTFSMKISSGSSPMNLYFISGNYKTQRMTINIASPAVTDFSLRTNDSYNFTETSTASSPYNQGPTACDEYHVNAHNGLGVQTSFDSNSTISLRETSNYAIFHTQPNCSDTGLAQYSLTVGTGQYGSSPIYVRINDDLNHGIEFKRDNSVFGTNTSLNKKSTQNSPITNSVFAGATQTSITPN